MYAKNTWEKYKDQLNEVFDYNEDYKHYISKNKTERACVKDSIKLAEEKGFKPLESFDTLKSGDKVYVTNREKNIALFIIGKKPLTEGMRILGAHIDSPRMDLKQNPLYDIKHDVNSFSFKTNFDEDKFVVLQIPYDKGWSLKANQEDVDIYKGQGGFISFLAKKGETNYYLEYRTPLLSESIKIMALGTALLSAYYIGLYNYALSKKKFLELFKVN